MTTVPAETGQPAVVASSWISRVPRAHRTPGRAVQVAGMLLLALSAVFPLLFMLSGAFRTQANWANSELGFPTTHSLSAFHQVWTAATLGIYLRNSAIVTGGTVVISLVIATMAGYAFSHIRWRFKKPVYFSLLAWLAVPPIALLIPIYEEMNRLGLIDTYWSVILLYTALNTPFNVYLMSSYMQGISGEFCEAARMDGANVHQIFAGVVLPLSRPAISTLAVFNFLFAWNEFIFALGSSSRIG